MLNEYIKYYGLEIFKKLTNVAKLTGLLYYYDFYIYDIDENISVSSLPRREHYNKVNNFDVIIGFLGENEYGNRDVEWIKNTNIKYYNISVPDYTSPQTQDYLKLYRILDSHPNSRILIHCYAGKGRSNCGVAAYLMYKYNMSANEAIKFTELRNPRSGMNRWQKGSLETLERDIIKN